MLVSQITHFTDYIPDERTESHYQEWHKGLDNSTAGRVTREMGKVRRGINSGCAPVRDEISEIKMDFGPGYRVYYHRMRQNLFLLLCAGDKSTQNQDILKAVALLKQSRS